MKLKAPILSILLLFSLEVFPQETPKFEYLVVDFGYLMGIMRIKTEGYLLVGNDVKEDLSAQDNLDYLSSLGWDLVSVVGSDSNNVFIFKRIKDERWGEIEAKLKADEAKRVQETGSKPEDNEATIPTSPLIKNWFSFTSDDPLTDMKKYIFTTESKTGKNSYGSVLDFTIRIHETGKCELYVNSDEYLGSSASVAWRIDKEDPVYEDWILSTDSEAAFYPGNHRELFKRLTEAKDFVFKITPYNKGAITATFDISGFREFLAENPIVVKILEGPMPPSLE